MVLSIPRESLGVRYIIIISSSSSSSLGPPCLLFVLMCTDPQPVAVAHLFGVESLCPCCDQRCQCFRIHVALTSYLGTLGEQELRNP